ncbi:MAG: hypothetical protein ACREIC_10010, partial [Limisphaerales bacterium]
MNALGRTEKEDGGMGLIIAVFVFFFFLVIIFIFIFHLGQLQRFGGDHFEIGTALGARDNFAFIQFVGIHVDIGVALRTNHESLLPSWEHFNILIDSRAL